MNTQRKPQPTPADRPGIVHESEPVEGLRVHASALTDGSIVYAVHWTREEDGKTLVIQCIDKTFAMDLFDSLEMASDEWNVHD
jgi:hypothetical protein